MLPKWKSILTNWINCYFNNCNKKDLPVNFESLLDIISHLRENLNLDESKSSLLDAHTAQEFMLEKYPDFKFENGTIEPDGEGDVYLVASLLLFFVCVNSKNMDMKSAMCNRLSAGDQEIILKFSKHLMECSRITITDVLAAIAEACGQDISEVQATSVRMPVTETPPALRSYHSEVRRLQAALDAERFDRTYLQEELNRTNMKVEKLLKDKEQYKIEIVNLKSQISQCCGQERESLGDDKECNNMSKLKRQLAETEERLVSAHEHLEVAQDEREMYKTKLNQLKLEHEELLALSRQESTRANSLAEALEIERRHTQSLRELVAELRQHNHLNRMDSSLLECDDPDASIHSLQHNTSACSEICANVIEVQLGEERAKIEALKQQIQILQDQLREITKKTEEEKESLTEIISNNESTISSLKHKLNEEIQEKNTLKIIFDNDVAKLNNELNELEQRLKGTQENSRNIIEKKMQEIQKLQEEKLSLLQSLQDKTTKMENIIKHLQDEIETEKSSKIRLRDDYDSHIMKLNEKVLNRNNELVELQNKILEKGEMIESLQLDLRREKELKEELSNKYNNELIHLNSVREQVQLDLQRKCDEARDLHKHLQQYIACIEEINKDNDHLKTTILQLQGDCEILKDSKEKLLVDRKNRDVKAEQIYKETENLKNLLCEEKQKLQNNLEETSVTLNTLESQLQNEIQLKLEMQSKLTESQDKLASVCEENIRLTTDIEKLSLERNENKRIINELDANLNEEQRRNCILKGDLTGVNSKLEKLTQEVDKNNTIMQDIQNELENAKKFYQEKLLDKDNVIKSLETKLDSEITKNSVLSGQLNALKLEKDELLGLLSEKDDKILQKQFECKTLSEAAEEYKTSFHNLEISMSEKSEEYNQLKDKYNTEISNLVTRLDETEKSLKEVMVKSNNVIDGKDLLIQTLNVRVEQMENMTKEVQENMLKIETEKQILIEQIHAEKSYRNNLEKGYLNMCSSVNNVREQLNEEVRIKDEEIRTLKEELQSLTDNVGEKAEEIIKLESLLMFEKQQNIMLQQDNNNEKINLTNKCGILEEDNYKAKQYVERREKENELLTAKVKELTEKFEKTMTDRDMLVDQLRHEKDAMISKLSKELVEEREMWAKELASKADAVDKLGQRLQKVTSSETDTVKLLKKENEILKKTLALKESFAVASQEKSNSKSVSQGVDGREQYMPTEVTPTEYTQSSFESSKTISDLEKILQDRNRTIRSLQSDVTDLKSLIAESENKLLDVSNDLEVSKENCHQLSSQLKKIVHQKNEEIADLKKQLTKMSMTENRATQIIKVSAKYQAIILKRIAEIKSNTVLKELTNFGNTTNCDNELRRGLNAGTITMEDLENFLDTTDRHLKRFSEKQLALQKERDRLAEVNKINESEIINMRKFLTELSVSIKTFNSVKELYTQKLSRVVSLQRTVRREILGMEGQITDATMCKLERGYAAVMQDLSECAMNLQRWVERTIARVISSEKIKQAFSSEERSSVATATVQNASLEVQLDELENSFCKLLEEIARAQKGEGAKDAQSVTVMEVRAEYEDKLNRMRAKMKQMYKEQIGIFKEKQREEIISLEQELQKARDKLEESSRAYEEHIRGLTTELWNVGEKFLMKKDEAEWLRRKQRSGSLMSLQHVHSAGLVPPQEEPLRPSDTHSLRSLPVTSNTKNKNEGRTLHMSDEEGEVFDNRCLRELASTPARAGSRRATRDAPPVHRLSELQWRNSLCPPHLKSSYPAETQFVSAIHEEDIKCVGGPSMSLGGRTQRKEVGITAYKKPGPPTPSKQAGRLSATDSELRESLRVEMEPNASRKTGTPSRIRALFRSAKGDNEGTPRSRRLSNIFRKK